MLQSQKNFYHGAKIGGLNENTLRGNSGAVLSTLLTLSPQLYSQVPSSPSIGCVDGVVALAVRAASSENLVTTL
jgi:hypothetical protein